MHFDTHDEKLHCVVHIRHLAPEFLKCGPRLKKVQEMNVTDTEPVNFKNASLWWIPLDSRPTHPISLSVFIIFLPLTHKYVMCLKIILLYMCSHTHTVNLL